MKNVYHLRKTDIDRCMAQMSSIEDENVRGQLLKAVDELDDYIVNLDQEVGKDWQFTNERQNLLYPDKIFIPKGIKPKSLNASSRSFLHSSSSLATHERDVSYSNRLSINNTSIALTLERNRTLARSRTARKRSAQSLELRARKRPTKSFMDSSCEKDLPTNRSLDSLQKQILTLEQDMNRKISEIHACLSKVSEKDS